MPTIYFISVLIHILSAIVWVGGMFFLILILIPVLRNPEYKSIFSTLFRRIGIRYRLIGWISLVLLIITGTINLAYRGYGLSDLQSGVIFQGTFGHILLQKLIIVALILIVSLIHDFWLGPRTSALIGKDPASLEAKRYRTLASWLGRVNFLMALIVVALAVMLVRGGL